MEDLGKVALRVGTKRPSSNSPSNAIAKRAKRDNDGVPVAYDGIDKLAQLISWRSNKGEIETTRALSPDERQSIEARAAALTIATAAHDEKDYARIEAVLAAMWSNWPSMQRRTEMAGALSFARAALREYPSWAIERACMNFARGKASSSDYNKSFPPSTPEIAEEAETILRPYRRANRDLVDLLKSTPRRD